MIAADSSVIIDYLQGIHSDHTNLLQEALVAWDIVLPPVVVTELFSSPKKAERLSFFLNEIEILDINENYWERAGKSRAVLKSKKIKSKIADALIAQSCIDHAVPLLTCDEDFRHYAKYCGLALALP